MAGHATLILEVKEFVSLLAHRDVAEVDDGLELDVGGGSVRVEVKTVRLGVTFCVDFNEIMELAILVGLKLDVHLG